ncbi:MAG: hypothetical protein H0V66_03455 [Bdellovibrionales bacterium]|nr:hypothetical protein [Bdellovibrionales bacterium]
MKTFFIVTIFLTSTMTSYAMVPEKVKLTRSRSHGDQNKYFTKIFRESRSAYALATAHIGTFKDPQLNALTNRIQDDQRVLMQTIQDTARMKDFELPASPGPTTLQRLSVESFLEQEIEIHENILNDIKNSSSPVLMNMRQRVQTALENARRIHDDRRQAQEEQAAGKRKWP